MSSAYFFIPFFSEIWTSVEVDSIYGKKITISKSTFYINASIFMTPITPRHKFVYTSLIPIIEDSKSKMRKWIVLAAKGNVRQTEDGTS